MLVSGELFGTVGKSWVLASARERDSLVLVSEAAEEEDEA